MDKSKVCIFSGLTLLLCILTLQEENSNKEIFLPPSFSGTYRYIQNHQKDHFKGVHLYLFYYYLNYGILYYILVTCSNNPSSEMVSITNTYYKFLGVTQKPPGKSNFFMLHLFQVLRQRSVDEEAEKAKRKKILFTQLNKIIKVNMSVVLQCLSVYKSVCCPSFCLFNAIRVQLPERLGSAFHKCFYLSSKGFRLFTNSTSIIFGLK